MRAPFWGNTQIDVQIKPFLNAYANGVLKRAGYSDARASEAKRDVWWSVTAVGEALRRRSRLLPTRQVVWTGRGRAELLDGVVPRAGRGEVTVRASSTIISAGTERAQFLKLPHTGASTPFKPGYSGSGIVEAVGAGVTGVAEGDRVAVRGLPHASRATVPAGSVHVVPESVSLADAAFIQLGVICSQGVRLADIAGGERICVVGTGLIGALTLRLARAAGAAEATVVARTRGKEALARRGGASSFVATGEGDDAAGIDADIVFEATGDGNGVRTAVAAARDGGLVVLLGSPRGVTVDFPAAEIVRRRIRLIGAHVETLTWEGRLTGTDLQSETGARFLAQLAAGDVQVDDLVTHAIDPREPELAYRELVRSSGAVAIRLDWSRLDSVPSPPLRPSVRALGVDASRSLPPVSRTTDPFAGAEGRLRIGLLGCGDIAFQNATGAMAAPNVELVAAFDPVPALAQEIEQHFGARAEPSVEALLGREDVDAVFVCVPHHLHLPLAVEAAEAGKHVIVEKPLAQDLASAVELSEAVARAGVVLSVCFPQRYLPQVISARRLVQEGAVGRVGGTFVKLLMEKEPSYWYGGFSGRAITTWRMSRAQAGGGILIMNLCHYLDVIRHVTGLEIEHVAASTAAVDGAGEVEDTVSVTLRYAGGAVGAMLGCASLRGQGEPESDVQIWGSEGRIVLEPQAAAMSLRSAEGRRTRRWYELPTDAVDVRAVYLSRLATAITRGEAPDVTAADGLAVQSAIEAAYRSAELDEPVRPVEAYAS